MSPNIHTHRHSPKVLVHFDGFLTEAYFSLTAVSVVLISLLAVRNLMTLAFLTQVYFKTMLNFSEVATVALSLAYVVISNINAAKGNHPPDPGPSWDAEVHLGSIALFVAWFNLTLLIGSLPSAGMLNCNSIKS